MLGADLEDSFENCVEFGDARRLGGLLDEDLSESWHPLQEPVAVALAKEGLEEVGESFKVLLVVVVVGDVGDHSVPWTWRFDPAASPIASPIFHEDLLAILAHLCRRVGLLSL